MSEHGRYLLDNQEIEAGERFDALSQLFNPSTFRHISHCGISEGWRVWEVGSGGPSVPRWLADRVGANGHVIATDIDTSWLHPDERGGFEVAVQDVARDPAPGADFDLIHARLVLVHVLERNQAISNMVNALRPGGWLIVEEADPGLQELVCLDEYGHEQELANKLKRGFRTLMQARGVDLHFARTLPRHFRAAGLVDVEADAYFPIGGPACTALEHSTIEQIKDRLIEAGLATPDEIARHLDAVDANLLDLATSPMISVWGRKPLENLEAT